MYGRTNEFNEQVRETEYTENIGSDQLISYQDRIMAEQDRGLETLSHIIRNQKQVAITIGSEVERQNTLIDSMGDKMDQVNERLVKETKHVKRISFKSSTCGKCIYDF